MTTRIGIIREAIKAEGGVEPKDCGLDYYCDGPRSGTAYYGSRAHRLRDEVIFKVDKSMDGLTVEARERVVDALRKHPDVKDAYLSRPYKHRVGKTIIVSHGHLKIVFQGTLN